MLKRRFKDINSLTSNILLALVANKQPDPTFYKQNHSAEIVPLVHNLFSTAGGQLNLHGVLSTADVPSTINSWLFYLSEWLNYWLNSTC